MKSILLVMIIQNDGIIPIPIWGYDMSVVGEE